MTKAAAKKTTAPPKGREVAKSTANAVSNVNVDLLEEQDAGKGVSTDVADNIVPLIKVLQALSPQVLKQKAEYIKGAEAGMIWPRGEKQVWDGEEEGIRIVPCYYERVWIEWGPKLGDGLKGRHRNGTDETPRELGAELVKNKEDKEVWTLPNGNILQDNREYAVLVLDKYDVPTPFVLPMSGSNIGTSRTFHPLMNRKLTKKGNKAASFRYVYQLTSVAKTKDQFNWHQMAITDLDERTSDEVYLLARRIHADFSGGVLVSDVEEPHIAEDDSDL